VVAGGDVVAAVWVPRDHRDRVGLDDHVGGQPPRLIGGVVRGGFMWVSDGDQIGHGFPFPEPWMLTFGHRKAACARPGSPRKRIRLGSRPAETSARCGWPGLPRSRLMWRALAAS